MWLWGGICLQHVTLLHSHMLKAFSPHGGPSNFILDRLSIVPLVYMSQHIIIVVTVVMLFTVTSLLPISSSIAQKTSTESFWTQEALMPTPRTEVTASPI
jgi:hypothetical protein